MHDDVYTRVIASLDNAHVEGEALASLESDLAVLRARLARLESSGLRTHESPYVAFARRIAQHAAPTALAASA